MEDLSKVLMQYYDYIGIIPNDTRQEDQVFARSAMMVVLRKQMTLHQIGRIFGKNHATIHHAVKNHEVNHNWSEMYRSFYEAAKEILYKNPITGFHIQNRVQAELTRYKLKVKELENELQLINNELLKTRQENLILQSNKELQDAI